MWTRPGGRRPGDPAASSSRSEKVEHRRCARDAEPELRRGHIDLRAFDTTDATRPDCLSEPGIRTGGAVQSKRSYSGGRRLRGTGGCGVPASDRPGREQPGRNREPGVAIVSPILVDHGPEAERRDARPRGRLVLAPGAVESEEQGRLLQPRSSRVVEGVCGTGEGAGRSAHAARRSGSAEGSCGGGTIETRVWTDDSGCDRESRAGVAARSELFGRDGSYGFADSRTGGSGGESAGVSAGDSGGRLVER